MCITCYLFLPGVRELISRKKMEELKILLSKFYFISIAERFEGLTSEEKLILFKY